MNYLIGTDIGTSGTKSIVMDTKGNLISSDLQEYDVLTPRPLWAEQWPDVWVDAVKMSIKNSVAASGVDPINIKGICISGLYGGSGIPLDDNMTPVRPCMIWMDRRAAQQEQWVLSHIGRDKIESITHNGTDPYYGYTKILWIKQNEPENWKKIKLFLPPNAYAIYKLTGEVAIDYSSAGNLGGIFDAKKRTWSFELMEMMEIPHSMMPQRLLESSDIVGFLTKEAANEIGLVEGTPVCAGGVDCNVATLGLGVFKPEQYAVAIGTSMCAALVHKEPLQTQGLIEMPYVKNGMHLYYSFGGAATAGALTKWFRDQFAQKEKDAELCGGRNTYQILDEEATELSPGSEGIVVLPYFMGERSPIWDTHARGAIIGLSLSHTRAHVWRAFLEAIAYSLRHTLESTGKKVETTLLVAGGAIKSQLWRQIIADVTGHPVVCPKHDVEANLGDVMLAGVGTGLVSWEEVKTWKVMDKKVYPNEKAHSIYNQLYPVYRSSYLHLKSDMDSLAKI